MTTLTSRAGFVLTDGDGHEIVHVLPCRLLFREGTFGDEETVLRTIALDQRTIQVETFDGGAEEVQARIRYDGDADGLRMLLREGSRGRLLTYYPDLGVPAEAYPTVLMDHGPVVRIAPDGGRFAYGEWEAAVTLRRIDGGSLAPLATGELFRYQAGSPLHRATFTRATAGTRVSAARRIETIASGLRRITWIERDGVLRPYTPMEAARTQVAANPQTPNSWSDIGTPIVTAGQTDPFGATDAILVEDNAGSATEGRVTSITLTGDGTKTFAVIVAPGTMASVRVRVHDNTAGIGRHNLQVTWNGSSPPTLTTVQGGGTIYGAIPIVGPGGRLWWIILFNADGMVAANSNTVGVVDFSLSGTGTGTFYLAGANAFDNTYPSSWQGPTLGTRNADQLVSSFPWAPQAMSVYLRFIEQASPNWVASGGGVSPRILHLGNTAPDVLLYKPTGTNSYQMQHRTAGGVRSPTVGLSPVYGDEIELFGQLAGKAEEEAGIADEGAVRLIGRKNGGSLVQADWSSGLPFSAAWSTPNLHIGGLGANGAGDIAVDAVLGMRGVAHTIDSMAARVPRFGG